MRPDTMIRRLPGPVETTVGTEVVLMELEAGACYGLGDTGSAVWRQLAVPVRFEGLVAALHAEYQAADGVLEQDVIELLEDLRGRGLIAFD